jgi:NAD+ dependent glucose-6-phosphate dehydrogenase
MPPLNVLVTGASGLIGGSLFQHLQRNPETYRPFGVSRRSVSSDRVSPDFVPDRSSGRFRVADLSEEKEARRSAEGMDAVVHLAADPRGDAPWESILKNNIIATRNVFEACRQANVKRVIFASSIMVSWGYRSEEPYLSLAKGRPGLIPESIPMVTHQSQVRPTTDYAAGKLLGEAQAQSLADTSDISAICVRIGWVVPENTPPSTGQDIWCSLGDINRLIECALKAPDELSFGIFYGLSESPYRWLDIAHGREVLGYVPEDSV